MSFLVGIDLGSGGCKATIIDGDGRCAGEAFREYPTVSPRPGWAEQNPADWLAAAREALADAMQQGRLTAREVAAVAVSGTTHSFVLTDSHNEILRPCILWTDIRSDREVEELIRSHGNRIFEITLHRPDVHWTLPQLLWVRHNEPQVWDKIDRLYMPKDFLRFALTGQWATDWMDGHGTLLFDVPRREWSRELCDLLGIRPAILPPAAPPQSLAGSVHAEAARRFGLCEGTPVVVGTTDQAAEAFGTGAVEPGQGIIKLATAGNVAVVTDKPHPHPPMVKAYYHLNPSCWYTLKGMISAHPITAG
ncbi:MAG: FGGY family carbohydrate kinase [Desulfobacterales bacterium]|nr:FGGY family carbohydrate kinase [Desulfobacterales bacterium]